MHSINLVHDLPPFDEQHNLRVVVETPRGANIKIKFDEDLGCFCLSRILPLGVAYPYDFGFVPQTLAQDGDPLDVLALIDAVTYPGVVVACRLLGALQVEERGLRGRPNHRLVAVPIKAARKDDLRNFIDLGRRAQQELERFFVMSSAFTSKDPVVRGWVGPEAASDMVHKAISRYREKHGLPPLPPRPHRSGHGRYGALPGAAASPPPPASGTAPSESSPPPPASPLDVPPDEPGGRDPAADGT
jgi:inorganic pyrophosphatase